MTTTPASLAPDVAGTGSLAIVDVGPYLEVARENGTPAYSVEELARAPQVARHQADVVLAWALPVSTATPGGGVVPAAERRCVVLAGGGASRYTEVPLSAGLTTIEPAPGPSADLALRRFAEGEFPALLDPAPGGAVTYLRIPRDLAARPWHLHVEASQRARVCT